MRYRNGSGKKRGGHKRGKRSRGYRQNAQRQPRSAMAQRVGYRM